MKLTISMAAYNDYDGCFFTIQSLRLHHKLPEGTEIVVLDNNPGGEHGKALANLASHIPELRIVPVADRKSSFVKYDIAEIAEGDIILGLDCHNLLEPGFIDALMEYWRANPDSCDMLTGPVLMNSLRDKCTSLAPRWRGDDFGCWECQDEAVKGDEPFMVFMQGMGCFSFLKKNMPKISSRFHGFGGEEWYVAEKVRQNGGRVICHPRMGWAHRFDWPVRAFPLRQADKVRNYYVGWLELYGSLDHPMIQEMTSHWKTLIAADELDSIIAAATR